MSSYDPPARHVLKVARALGGILSRDVLETIVEHVAEAAGANSALIAELDGEPSARLRTIAFWMNGMRSSELEYDLRRSFAKEVLNGRRSTIPNSALRLFPADTVLRRANAEAAAGVRLVASNGEVIGLLLLTYAHALRNARLSQGLLSAFAPRCSLEVERKREREALEKSDQRYRAFIKNAIDAIWRVEFVPPIPTELPENIQIDRMLKSGFLAECNDALARQFGRNVAEEIIGASFEDLVAKCASIGQLREALRSGYKATGVEVQATTPDGERSHRVRSYWGIVEGDMLHRFWGTTRDITGLRQAELRLETSERQFRHLLETVRLLAVILDTQGQIEFANPELLRITGWSKEDLNGQNWFELLVPSSERESARTAFRGALSGPGEAYHLEAPLLKRDGNTRLVAWDNAILEDSAGNVIGAAALGRDITDSRAMEEQLRHTDRLESVGRLAAGVAHDFGNLLTVILGNAEFLLGTMLPDSPGFQKLTEIIAAGERGAALSRHLLDFSRQQNLKPGPIDLNAVLKENEKLLRRLAGKGVRFVIDLSPNPGRVSADPEQICQVVMNLVINAREAMPQGGTLRIATEALVVDEHRPVEFSQVPHGAYTALTVTDTGAGMTPEVQARLFEPFFTTKTRQHGRGIGLSTMYGIVRQSGGHILVRSSPGTGATFTVLLNRVDEARNGN